MPGDFLGVGWSFPVGVDDDGQVRLSAYEESIREAITIILGTSKGERVMRPEFGCGLNDLVFSTNSASTIGRVAYEVRQALERWEPRVELLSVDVRNGDAPEVLQISIECRVVRTNTRFNMVYPFYLRMRGNSV